VKSSFIESRIVKFREVSFFYIYFIIINTFLITVWISGQVLKYLQFQWLNIFIYLNKL